MSDEILVKRLGVVPYLVAWELQKAAEQRRRDEIPAAFSTVTGCVHAN